MSLNNEFNKEALPDVDEIIIKIITILQIKPSLTSSILKILLDLETSDNQKELYGILEYVSDYIKEFNIDKTNQMWKRFPIIFLPKVLQDIAVTEDDYEFSDIIFEDTFFLKGVIGKLKKGNTSKVVNIRCYKLGFPYMFLDTAAMMCKLKHENILPIYAFSIDKHYTLFTEYMEKGTLEDNLKCHHSVSQLLKYILDITSGLEHVFEHKYILGNLGPEVFQINSSNVCKISRFGCTKYMNDSEYFSYEENPYKFCYSPERLIKKYYYATDIYQLGVLFYLVLESPFMVPLMIEMYYYRLQMFGYHIFEIKKPSRCPIELVPTLKACFDLIPERRPKINQIKQCIIQCLSKIN